MSHDGGQTAEREVTTMQFSAFMPRIEFGDGKIDTIAAVAKEHGRTAFLAIDPYLVTSGLAEEIRKKLKQGSIEAVVHSDIQPNPDCYSIDKAGAIARQEKCDLVIAVGGGSAMDYGKAVAVVATHPGESWRYTRRSDHEVLVPGEKTLPVIAVPTTAGTGSEATTYAVLNNTRIHEKSTIISAWILPRISIVDPGLMVSMPPQLTALTGIDALAHAIESYINLAANPFNRMLALESIRLVAHYLPAAVANGQNLAARAQMAWASTLAGGAIGFVATTLPHSMGQAVGGFKNAPHGATLTAVLVKVLEFSWRADLDLFAAISEALDPETRSLSVRARAEMCPRLVERLLVDTGTIVRLSDFGLTAADIDRVTQIAFTGYGADIGLHPKKATVEDVKRLYQACL
jgi:alcohol dehydrogenase class IV